MRLNEGFSLPMLIAPNIGTDTLNPLFPSCLYIALGTWLAIVVTAFDYEQEMGTMRSSSMLSRKKTSCNWMARSGMILSIGDTGERLLKNHRSNSGNNDVYIMLEDYHEKSPISRLVNQSRQCWDAGASIARIKRSAWIMRCPEYICRVCNPLSPTLM